MFIKAHIRGGYRAAAHYLEAKGKNEVSRLIHISDPDAKTLDEAFHNMWQVASATKTEKPLFHFSINPFKDERLTDAQVKRIAESYITKCKMDMSHHQHVIVEHIKEGRQHFHIMLNRVDQLAGKAVDPGLYKKKAKECAREMEKELGLRMLIPKKGRAPRAVRVRVRRPSKTESSPKALASTKKIGSPVLRPGRRAVPARRTLLAEEDIDAWWMQRYQLRSYIPRVRRGPGNRTVMQRLRKTYNRIIQKRS